MIELLYPGGRSGDKGDRGEIGGHIKPTIDTAPPTPGGVVLSRLLVRRPRTAQTTGSLLVVVPGGNEPVRQGRHGGRATMPVAGGGTPAWRRMPLEGRSNDVSSSARDEFLLESGGIAEFLPHR